MRKVWGCEERTQMSEPTFKYEENGVVYQYWNCPINFIHTGINKFFEIYDYLKEFNIILPMPDKINRRFLKAMRYYQNEYALSVNMVREKG